MKIWCLLLPLLAPGCADKATPADTAAPADGGATDAGATDGGAATTTPAPLCPPWLGTGAAGRVRHYQVRKDVDGGGTTGTATWTTQAASWSAATVLGVAQTEPYEGGRTEVRTTEQVTCDETGAHLFRREIHTTLEDAFGEVYETLYTWTWANPQLLIPADLAAGGEYTDTWVAVVEGTTSLGGEFHSELTGSVVLVAGEVESLSLPAGTFESLPLAFDVELGGAHQEASWNADADLGMVLDATWELVTVDDP